jgi:hypothetical protein
MGFEGEVWREGKIEIAATMTVWLCGFAVFLGAFGYLALQALHSIFRAVDEIPYILQDLLCCRYGGHLGTDYRKLWFQEVRVALVSRERREETYLMM